MKTLTVEIKNKIKEETIKRLQDGRIDYFPEKDLVNEYFKMLCEAWINEEIVFDWELK